MNLSSSSMSLSSAELRERLGLSQAEWARALGVNPITVKRWEEGGADPGGIAAEVMLGLVAALDEGRDPVRVGQIVRLGGIRSLICYGLGCRATCTHPMSPEHADAVPGAGANGVARHGPAEPRARKRSR